MLGKTFKGLTDELLAWQTERLLALADRSSDGHVVLRAPRARRRDRLRRRPDARRRYPGGMALRFARVRRYREDKRGGRGRHRRHRARAPRGRAAGRRLSHAGVSRAPCRQKREARPRAGRAACVGLVRTAGALRRPRWRLRRELGAAQARHAAAARSAREDVARAFERGEVASAHALARDGPPSRARRRDPHVHLRPDRRRAGIGVARRPANGAPGLRRRRRRGEGGTGGALRVVCVRGEGGRFTAASKPARQAM